MNIVRGSKVEVVVKSGRGFKAEVVGSWYDLNGHHHFGLEILETTGYKKKPKSVWRGKDLYDVVVKHIEGPDHEAMAKEKQEDKLASTPALAEKAIHLMSAAERQTYEYECALADNDCLVSKGFNEGDVFDEGLFVVSIGGTVVKRHKSMQAAINHAIGSLEKEWIFNTSISKTDRVVSTHPVYPGLLILKTKTRVALIFENYKKN